MLVIEGADASGKSTLAKYLSRVFHSPVASSEGPPKYPGEINERCIRYSQLPPSTIFDRHPAISQPIYSRVLNRQNDLDFQHILQFYNQHPTIIYCDAVSTMLGSTLHQVKDHDREEHLHEVHEKYDELIATYRAWAIHHAHIIYRIGDPMERIANFCNDFDPVADIDHFHRHFHVAYDGPPRSLPPDVFDFRVQFMAEELCEYVGVSDVTKKLIQSALSSLDWVVQQHQANLHNEFDALIDLVYVALGTAHLQGLDFREGWRRVHHANMTKIRARKAEDSARGYVYDVVKPPDFEPPNLTDLLQR
jgi:predicted HAD superfamily Cof-like phosphohydrolase